VILIMDMLAWIKLHPGYLAVLYSIVNLVGIPPLEVIKLWDIWSVLHSVSSTFAYLGGRRW